MDRKQIKRQLKHFTHKTGLPKTVYDKRCRRGRADVCGGQGNTCAPEDAPEDFDELLERFCDEYGYNYGKLSPVPTAWKNEIADLLPR